MKSSSLFDRIGAEQLRAVITELYRRIFDDVMIGFMFQGKDRQHLIDREWELAAALLGAPGVVYRGRSMRVAHAQHSIFGGHFERRLQLLRETMRDLGVDLEVQREWLAHTESLRAQITSDRGSECKDTSVDRSTLALPTESDRVIKLGRKR